jgi:uncharacterized membrane protein YphA (DoxX/SURF4 family)
MKKYIATIVALWLPLVTFAHVKWFVDSQNIVTALHGKIPFYYLTSTEVVVWSVVTLVVVLIFSVLDRVITAPKALSLWAQQHENRVVRWSEILLGLFLITVTVIWQVVLVPEFPIMGVVGTIAAVMQLGAGLMLVFRNNVHWALGMLAAVYSVVGYMVGVEMVLENILLLGLMIYICIKEFPRNSIAKRLDKYAVEIVRISTGISLLVLAFTEKLAYPELSIEFLKTHQWNFMQLAGFVGFSNELFVLSVGFAEMIFGILFIMGYLTRITTGLIAVFFATSVVTMLVQFGRWEVEDLVVYAAAIILLAFGSGATRMFRRNKLVS